MASSVETVRPLRRVLIANRGEIALRILRACHEMGLSTVAVYSSADREQQHVKLASQSVCIGGAKAADSYLNANAIISAALVSGADAIHPGYGFLSENAAFAAQVEACGLTFIGPKADTIALMGDKISAIAAMKKAGIPTIVGSDGPLTQDASSHQHLADRIGYPLIIKAAGGGGGKGMRVVLKPDDLAQAIDLTRQEALAAFNNDTLYMERYLSAPRHIEIQVASDGQGNAIHLGERDCSLQRRHQKLIEEAPALGIDAKTRREIGERCVKACLDIDYRGVGTFEFLYQDGEFFFIEMNTRLQVEHTVTEMVTGLDIVKLQLQIAAGHSLTLAQSDIIMNGHAVECRINAEHPFNGIPSPGQVTKFHAPNGYGVRWESQLYAGYYVPPFYDPMVGKLICVAQNRLEALAKMQQALTELCISGIETNIELHLSILRHPEFINGSCNIHFLSHESTFSSPNKVHAND